MVGRSTFEETQQVFSEALGFSELPNLMVDPDLNGHHFAWNRWDLVPATRTRGSEWFYIGASFNDSARKLEAIDLSGASDQFEPYTSPVRVIRKLGQPWQILISPISLSEDPSAGATSLMLLYQNGIALDYSFRVAIENDGVHIGGNANVCLGHLPGLTGPYWVESYIGPPIVDLDSLSPIQKIQFGDDIKALHYQSFESLFGVSPAEVTTLAQQQSNPCFSTKVP